MWLKMKTTILIVFLLIFWNGCATKPVIPQKPIVYSTGDRNVYMSLRSGKGGDVGIIILYTMDTVAKATSYSFQSSVKEYSKQGNTYDKLDKVYQHQHENKNTFKYRLENGNVSVGNGDIPFYSSENFIKEYLWYKNFFELLSPNFKNMNNAERAKLIDSLAQIEW